MCGIAGLVKLHPDDVVEESVLKDMRDVLRHRGPDGEGLWIDGCVGLGHRRLAIIDLSPLGRQPMVTRDGRYTLTYNGEIYNFRELRAELTARGCSFNSRSDSEVLLYAFATWGLDALSRLNGMFAFAIWDRTRQRLLLARDRLGIKPLYYTLTGGRLIFASEIKAILEHPSTSRELIQLLRVPREERATFRMHLKSLVTEGELLQIHNRNNTQLDEAVYLEIITRKTAVLCATCCLLGAKLAGSDDDVASRLETFGLSLGVAFHVVFAQFGRLGAHLCHVDPAPVGQAARLDDEVVRRVVDALVEAELVEPGEAFVARGGGEHTSTCPLRHLYGGETDTPGTGVDQRGFTSPEPAELEEAVVGGPEGNGNRCGLSDGKSVRDSPREALTDGPLLGVGPVDADAHHPIAHREARDAVSAFGDGARRLVAHDVGHASQVAAKTVERVATLDADGLHLDEDLPGAANVADKDPAWPKRCARCSTDRP
jgi:hypothetical protein